MSLWIAPRPLVLASRSPARRHLLAAAGIEFVAVAPDLDERALEVPQRTAGASPSEIASYLACAKADAVCPSFPGDLILAADQVLECDGRVFAKPGSRAEAGAQLAELAGRTHRLHSAFCLKRNSQTIAEKVVVARLTMRPFDRAFLDRYLESAGDTVLGSVGAYQYESLGVHLFVEVEGDHSTILGLPLLSLLAALRAEGVVAS